MTAQERLIKNKAFIDLVIVHEYVPNKDHAQLMEVIGALKELSPGAKYDVGCTGCLMDIMKDAKRRI